MRLIRDASVSAITAGFLAVLISYSGPLLIFYQAGQSAQVAPDMMASWVWGISMGAAVSGIFLSWALKVPVVTAWSAPGTALLVTLFPVLSLHQAVGAYLVAGVVILAIGVSGYFDKAIKSIPRGIAYGMMAGILFQFGAGAFKAASTMPLMAFSMIAAYVVLKRFSPRYFLVLVLLVGMALAVLVGGASLSGVQLGLTRPIFIEPEWTVGSTLSLALPLVLVSLTGQFLPGMAILHGAGYRTPARPIIAVTGLVSLGVAFVGGITIVIAAITAALCTGKDAHDNPDKRYVAGIANGVFYLIGGTFAGTIISLFTSLPKAFVAVLAGLSVGLPASVETMAQALAAQFVARTTPGAADSESGQAATEFATVDVASLELVQPRSVGVEHVELHALAQLQLEPFLASLGVNTVTRRIMLMQVAAPGSELATWGWLNETSALPELLELSLTDLSLMRLYRSANVLVKHQASIAAHLFARVQDLFSFAPTVTPYDLANTYFEGDMAGKHGTWHGGSQPTADVCAQSIQP